MRDEKLQKYQIPISDLHGDLMQEIINLKASEERYISSSIITHQSFSLV